MHRRRLRPFHRPLRRGHTEPEGAAAAAAAAELSFWPCPSFIILGIVLSMRVPMLSILCITISVSCPPCSLLQVLLCKAHQRIHECSQATDKCSETGHLCEVRTARRLILGTSLPPLLPPPAGWGALESSSSSRAPPPPTRPPRRSSPAPHRSSTAGPRPLHRRALASRPAGALGGKDAAFAFATAFAAKTPPLLGVSAAFAAKTPPLPGVSAAVAVTTPPLPGVSTAFAAKTAPLPGVSAAVAVTTPPLPGVSTAFAAKTPPLPRGPPQVCESKQTASGRVYYYNKQTGQSSWEPPPGFTDPEWYIRDLEVSTLSLAALQRLPLPATGHAAT